ncbi:MAG TPA: GGDEF domain-containing protein [Candidatus Nanopelagicales bacterium]|nr:GGDEF domain-containing protein [Candidatus Nanopelagicales bacterium]
MTPPDRSTDPRTLLAAAAHALARGADLDATLEALLGDAAAATGAELAALFTWGGAGDVLQLTASHGFPPPARGPFEAEVAGNPDHPIAIAARTARPMIGRVATRADGSTMTGVDLPLVVAREGIEEPLGVLSFGWSGDLHIEEEARATLAAAADLAALALDRERLASLASERADWMGRISTADRLTGLANRRTLDRVLELEIERAKRQQTDVSVAVFDIDGFRALNEGAGAGEGDVVLRRVASILAEQVRLVDTVARIGGDEFAVVAPGSGGVVVADRLLRSIAALEPVGGVPLSVSAGVARFPADGTSADELLLAALGALGAARESGRGAIAEVGVG